MFTHFQQSRKGDSSLNAMWLVLMIGLFLIVYIIILPVGEKEKLIGEQPIYGPGGTGGYPGGQISSGLFLSENPGLVYPLTRQVIGKPLASMNLFSFMESNEQGLANTVTVKTNFFGTQKKELTFLIKDLSKVSGVQLLFLVKDAKGDLVVKLNGDEIFRGEVSADDLPLPLPTALLKPVNKLEFTVSSPGLNIFGTNQYILKDVQIFIRTAEEHQQETRTFVLSESDTASLGYMTLFFVVNCFTVQENGRLVITLNGRVIHDALVVCDAGPVSVDIDPQDVVAGINVMTFAIDKGKYVLEQIVLEKDVGEHETQRYVFTMQVDDFRNVQAGARVVMSMDFPADGLRKIGAAYINGYPIYIDTYGPQFVFDITGLVGPGTNIIRIVPEVPMDIVSLNVGLA